MSAGFPKPETQRRRTARLRSARTRVDVAASHLVLDRACGRCERCLMWFGDALEVHHLLSGNGRRGRGESALEANKLALCRECHREIHHG